jgi:hypothetical protein
MNIMSEDLKTKIDPAFIKRWFSIVERTARVGLQESEMSDEAYRKWFLLWCCDISGELGEIDDNCVDICEIGDVLWGVSALWQLNRLPLDELLYQDTNLTTLFQAIKVSLKLLEHGKKLLRDGKARQPDKELVKGVCIELLCWLAQNYNLDDALAAVERKLLKRYPDGFTPEASVNRAI